MSKRAASKSAVSNPEEDDGHQVKRVRRASQDLSSNVRTVYLDGNSLSVDLLMQLCGYLTAENSVKLEVDLTAEAWKRVTAAREVVEEKLRTGQIVYGISTGFGLFSNVTIDKKQVKELQVNLIRSHACGVGEPLSVHSARALFILRVNTLAKGHSGIRPQCLKRVIEILNSGCVPWVPVQGSVGASGDLAPLAHLALTLMGEGKMWDPRRHAFLPAGDVLKDHRLRPISLEAKEGLSLINGTQFITSLAAEALHRARIAMETADVLAALTVEALQGTYRAFISHIHEARPHSGQTLVARRLMRLLHSPEHPSEIFENHSRCDRVQDAYALRCVPQVHGVSVDTHAFVTGIIETEMNSATDNPMVFANETEPYTQASEKSSGFIVSGGNFHGEYPAKAMDYLAIGIQEIGSISERRVSRLLDPALSGLPAFLVPRGGLNSGYMMAHVTAAALVSENKTLSHPASVDSIPTSANKEDHVSMGAWAARKCLQVVKNVENILAVELLCAVQALEYHRPLKSTEALERAVAALRAHVPRYETDRYMAPDMEKAAELIRNGVILDAVGELESNHKRNVGSATSTKSRQ